MRPEEALKRFLFFNFMTQTGLPTFRRWGSHLLQWKRAIIIALLVVVQRVGTNYLKEYYAVIEPCDQPCQDAISCDPLEFTFEVMPAKIVLGTPYYLWYRARLKNRSCRRLGSVYVKEFLDPENLRKSAMGLSVAVIGPDGREIDRLPPHRPDGGISWDYGTAKGVAISTEGTVYPYRPNYPLILQMLESKKFGGSYFVDLNPGETFETISPLLSPSRIVAWSFRTEDGGLGDGYRWVKVENPPKFSTPPEGFNLLDRYSFDRPGRYTIKAGFIDKIGVYPIFSRWEKSSHWLDLFFWGAYPSSLEFSEREIDLVAPPVTIEVSR